MKLRLTRRETAQIDKILGEIASQSPQGASSVSARVSEVLEPLLQLPFTGRRTARRGIRRITIVPYPYNIDCRLDRDDVVVLGIRHASRRPQP